MPIPLHPDVVAAALHAAPVGHTCRFWPVLDSTQDTARSLATRGAVSGTVVLAGVQTAGRGTRGRRWLAEPGAAILFSAVLALPPVPSTWLTAVAGVAVVEVVAEVGGVDAALTWPNDVMVQGRKLAGVLTEVPAGLAVGIVGIGINLSMPAALPADAVPPAALDLAMGRPADSDALVIALARRLAAWHQTLMDGDLLAARSRWRAHLSTIGRDVVVRDAGGEFRGVAVDVTADGALVVALADGRTREVATGRVRKVSSCLATSGVARLGSAHP